MRVPGTNSYVARWSTMKFDLYLWNDKKEFTTLSLSFYILVHVLFLESWLQLVFKHMINIQMRALQNSNHRRAQNY